MGSGPQCNLLHVQKLESNLHPTEQPELKVVSKLASKKVDMADATDSPTKRAVLEVRKQEGNDVCADCGQKGGFVC